jgi:hypothetical protein
VEGHGADTYTATVAQGDGAATVRDETATV